MGFFEYRPLPPPPEPPRRRPPVWQRPEAAIGGVAPGEIVLARSDDAAVAASGFRAYSNGFELTLTVLLRREDPWGRGMVFHRLHERPPGEGLPEEFLRFGVLFADGTSATNLGRRHIAPDESLAPPVLMQQGGGGGGRRFDFRYWVWPLPPAGPITFVVEWPWKGIPESRAEIDAAPILDAATRAVQVFPEDEEE
jgi:hypothetical protein